MRAQIRPLMIVRPPTLSLHPIRPAPMHQPRCRCSTLALSLSARAPVTLPQPTILLPVPPVVCRLVPISEISPALLVLTLIRQIPEPLAIVVQTIRPAAEVEASITLRRHHPALTSLVTIMVQATAAINLARTILACQAVISIQQTAVPACPTPHRMDRQTLAVIPATHRPTIHKTTTHKIATHRLTTVEV